MKSSGMRQLFTKERREGLARLFDTLAASAIIGAALGLVGRTPMTVIEIYQLVAIAVVLIFSAFLTRGDTK